jgi:hypothetical protein
MTVTGNALRQRRAKAKREAAGLRQINVWLPVSAVAAFRQAAAAIRANPDLTLAVNRKTKPPARPDPLAEHLWPTPRCAGAA